MRACALEYAEELKRALDEDKPGWTREQVRCPLHGGYHELVADPGQLSLLAGAEGDAGRPRWPGPRFRLLASGLACFHESTSDALAAPCAYCGTTLHAHKDALGRVKSGRQGTGYLEERCPACHQINAVFPAYGLGGIRVAKIAEGAPAMQMKLG